MDYFISHIFIKFVFFTLKAFSGLLNVFPKEIESISWRDIYTLMFNTATFATAKIRKRPQYPSVDEVWRKYSIWLHTHRYTHTHRNIIKFLKERNCFIYDNMNKHGEHFGKWNETDAERQILHDLLLYGRKRNAKLMLTESKMKITRPGKRCKRNIVVRNYKHSILGCIRSVLHNTSGCLQWNWHITHLYSGKGDH